MRAVVVALATTPGAGSATAQQGPRDFPSRPIRMIVPFAAGGPTDLVGRVLIQKLSASLGQPIVLDNRGGASASAELVARLYADTAKALGEAYVKQRVDEIGLEPAGPKPDEFAKFIARDVAFMRDLANKIGARATPAAGR